MSNRLAAEHSPYLLQHKDNPVDWHPWGDEAFDRARREDKPIFLSIGYSTCHWCHVMEHESFEDARRRRRAQPGLHLDQGRSRRAARRGPRLHDVRAGDDRIRRLADERLADAVARAVLRRHVLSAGVEVGKARVRRHPPGDRARLARGARQGRNLRRRHRRAASNAQRGWWRGQCRRQRARPRRARRRGPAVCRRLRRAARRVRRRAEIPEAERAAVPAARACANRIARGARHGAGHAAGDGARRHARSPRRRLPSLFGRRRLARPALREDAVRPGPARARVSRGRAGLRAIRSIRTSRPIRSRTSRAI